MSVHGHVNIGGRNICRRWLAQHPDAYPGVKREPLPAAPAKKEASAKPAKFSAADYIKSPERLAQACAVLGKWNGKQPIGENLRAVIVAALNDLRRRVIAEIP